MIGKYKLTRLPDDADGKVCFTHERIENTPRPMMILVDFDWEELRKKAAKLKVGQSIIIDYDKRFR